MPDTYAPIPRREHKSLNIQYARRGNVRLTYWYDGTIGADIDRIYTMCCVMGLSHSGLMVPFGIIDRSVRANHIYSLCGITPPCPDIKWRFNYPDSKVYGANMGPTWVLSDPDELELELELENDLLV